MHFGSKLILWQGVRRKKKSRRQGVNPFVFIFLIICTLGTESVNHLLIFQFNGANILDVDRVVCSKALTSSLIVNRSGQATANIHSTLMCIFVHGSILTNLPRWQHRQAHHLIYVPQLIMYVPLSTISCNNFSDLFPILAIIVMNINNNIS
jgi:hypothetical protein